MCRGLGLHVRTLRAIRSSDASRGRRFARHCPRRRTAVAGYARRRSLTRVPGGAHILPIMAEVALAGADILTVVAARVHPIRTQVSLIPCELAAVGLNVSLVARDIGTVGANVGPVELDVAAIGLDVGLVAADVAAITAHILAVAAAIGLTTLLLVAGRLRISLLGVGGGRELSVRIRGLQSRAHDRPHGNGNKVVALHDTSFVALSYVTPERRHWFRSVIGRSRGRSHRSLRSCASLRASAWRSSCDRRTCTARCS